MFVLSCPFIAQPALYPGLILPALGWSLGLRMMITDQPFLTSRWCSLRLKVQWRNTWCAPSCAIQIIAYNPRQRFWPLESVNERLRASHLPILLYVTELSLNKENAQVFFIQGSPTGHIVKDSGQECWLDLHDYTPVVCQSNYFFL